jgi:uncharacterized protein YjiK
MTGVPVAAALLLAVWAGAACRPARDEAAGQESLALTARASRLEQALARPDSGDKRGDAIARWVLPETLREISGLALTADGRLLTVGDERGKVFEVDYRRGVMIKEFTLGHPALHEDFESIAVAGDKVFLLASNGVLYEVPEGADGATVAYTRHDAGLARQCEFEGVAFDPAIHSLLLACKTVHDKALRDSLVIYRWTLPPGSNPTLSHLAVSLKRVIGSNGWDGLHPSDLTIDPFNGNYVLVAAREQALIEITPAGDVVFARPLPGVHDQGEGVAITKDSILIISDERVTGPAVITLYRWP